MKECLNDVRIEKNRLIWRCRQGTRELEILLIRYIDSCFDSMTRAEQLTLQALLEHSNPDLIDWLVYGATVHDSQFSLLIKKIRAFSV